jgi:hypothetical protein
LLSSNLLARQYFHRSTDLSTHSQAQLDQVALRLNQRPRKTVAFQTPANRLQASVALTGWAGSVYQDWPEVVFSLPARLTFQIPANTRYTSRREPPMSQDQHDIERLKQEHAAVSKKLESLREEAKRLGHEFEQKFKPEILEAEVELTRLSALLGSIGL